MKFARHALPMLLLLTTLTACKTTQTTGIETKAAKDSLCEEIFKRLSFSGQSDSQETVKGIRRHNARWRSFCGFKDPLK